MATLKAQFDFRVDDLVLAGSAYGATIEFSRCQYAVQVQFPKEQDGGGLSGWKGDKSDPEFAYITLMRVSIVGEATVGSRAFAGPQRDEAFLPAIAFADAALELARKIAGEVLDWIRISGQWWLCLQGHLPEWSGGCLLVDCDTGERLPTGPTHSLVRTCRDLSLALDAPYLDTLPHLLSDKGPPLPLAETVLADALYLVEQQISDMARAVLVAAMACELKVKEVLRGQSSEQLRPVVDLLLGSPRDWSLAAIALFDKGMNAVVQHSLKKDDPHLFKRIDKLFELRNGIAHRGRSISKIEAQDVVLAARSAFEWLRRVSGGRSDITQSLL